MAIRQIGNSVTEWGLLQQALHWTTVVLVIVQVWLGFSFAAAMPDDPAAGTYVSWHVATGATIFAVTAIRLAWRLSQPVPALPDDLTPRQKSISRLTHHVLYGLLLVQPVTGFLTWAGRGGTFPFDAPAPVGPFAVLHVLGVAMLIAVASLHVVAALRHEFVLRDNVLRRMTPLPRRPGAADRKPPPGPEEP